MGKLVYDSEKGAYVIKSDNSRIPQFTVKQQAKIEKQMLDPEPDKQKNATVSLKKGLIAIVTCNLTGAIIVIIFKALGVI
jgi:hypothetical protein